MAKVINAVFGGGLFATTAKVFQYDVGDRLRFLGIELPDSYSVDFANSRTGESRTVLGGADGVEIPPEFFVPGAEIYAWVVISDSDGHYTRYQAKIPIYERASRTSVEPTPAQADALDEAIAALNSAVEDVQEIADGIPDQIDAALEEAKESGEFDGPPGPKGDAYVLTEADRAEIAGIASDDVLVVSDEEPTGSPLPKIWIDSDDDGTVLVPTMNDIGDLSDLVTTAKGNLVAAINEAAQSGGSGGTGDYDDLINQPQINGVELSGNKSTADLGLEPEALTVTVTESGSRLSADKTYQQIVDAKAAGKRVAAYLDELVFDLSIVDEQSRYALFAATIQGQIEYVIIGNAGDVTITGTTVGTYSKPSGGIPKTDLASAVQTSLGKADTALQSVPSTYRTAAAQDVIDQQIRAAIPAGALVVTATFTSAAGGDCDKTTSEIQDAMDDGRVVYFTGTMPGVGTVKYLATGYSDTGSGVAIAAQAVGEPHGAFYDFYMPFQDDGYRFSLAERQFLDTNLGSANAGKFLVVGSDGVVVPTTVPSAQGVSF